MSLLSYAAEGLIKYAMPCCRSSSKDSSEWNGRTCLYIVVGALVCTGTLTGGATVVAYLVPMNGIVIPNWLLGAAGGAISVITCSGAGCLCANIPKKEYEDSVVEFKEIALSRERDNEKLRNELREMDSKIKILSATTISQTERVEVIQKNQEEVGTQVKENKKDLVALLQQTQELKGVASDIWKGLDQISLNNHKQYEYSDVELQLAQGKELLARGTYDEI
jgi:hypothetical protein